MYMASHPQKAKVNDSLIRPSTTATATSPLPPQSELAKPITTSRPSTTTSSIPSLYDFSWSLSAPAPVPSASPSATTTTATTTTAPTTSPHRNPSVSSASGSPSSRTQRSASFFSYIESTIENTIENTHKAFINTIIEPVSRAHRNSAIGLGRIASNTDIPSSSGLSVSRRGSAATNNNDSASEVPPSTRYADTDPNQPRPATQQSRKAANKMHQTSSRLLRMTDDERPFTRDFNDLFSTLIVSLLPFSAHRVRLTKVEYTFLSEDAINNLGSLKFSQSNRMPDPRDPSRIVATTTTTTFSMAKDMARVICQRFLEARFIESADGKYQTVYSMKGTVWQLTPKGITVLDRFCSRNGIHKPQTAELAANAITNLVLLERDQNTDKLVTDQGTMEVIFRRFVGLNGRNIKSTVNAADSDSLSDYRDGLTGVKMASERKLSGKTYRDTFTGKAAADWLMDCSTTVDRRETVEIGSLFVQYGLIEAVAKDKAYLATYPEHDLFQPTKSAIFQITSQGKDLINGIGPRGRTSESDSASARGPIMRDSNTQRLDKILNDAALRLLFRENLRDTHCEENLSFYLDVDEFVRHCRATTRTAQESQTPGRSLPQSAMDSIKEIMAQAYGIYNGFLAPGSPCELNIDHQLRNNLATRMTKAVGQDVGMIETLQEVTALFEDAQNAVFKLMASDSVPKFLRSAKYEQTLKHYDLDGSSTASQRGPERSHSRSTRTTTQQTS